jgi:hypothetical protein
MDVDVVEPFVIGVTIPVTPSVTVTATGGEAVVVVPTPGIPGAAGPTGPAGNNSPVFNETPSGTQDGTNETFTLANNFQAVSTRVSRNGLREQLNVGYTEASPTIVFTTAPLPSDVLTVDYLIA